MLPRYDRDHKTSPTHKYSLKEPTYFPSPTPSLPVCRLCSSTSIHLTLEHAEKQTSLSKPSRVDQSPNKMGPTRDALLRRWHGMLGLSRQSPPSWYRDRLREELRERRTAKTPWRKLSETSDVFFSISRAQYDGFSVRKLPPFVASRHVLVYAYMLAKYTSRWISTERPLSSVRPLGTT